MSDISTRLKDADLAGLVADGLREAKPPAPSTWEPPTPEDLKGVLPRHEIIRLVGRGGMGAVYEARQLDLDRRVAVKILPVELSADEAFAERFRREARILGRLRHPNILEVYEFGESIAGHLFFTMEYMESGDLGARLRRGPLGGGEVFRMVKEICAALEAAHAVGVIHRDIKPCNILLTAEGAVKVADFGIAVRDDQPRERLTFTGLAVGTMAYAAPEQAAGKPSDARSDLYSVGVLFYELLTGTLPCGVFDPPSKVNGDFAPAVDQVVRTAMQSDPRRRYQSATDFRTALQRSSTALPRNKRGALLAGIVALALLAAAAAIHHWRPPPPATTAASVPGAAIPPAPGRTILPEEAALEKRFADLARPEASAQSIRQWASDVADLGHKLDRDAEKTALWFQDWISRIEARRSARPGSVPWTLALSGVLIREAHIIQGPMPKQSLEAFLRAFRLNHALLKSAPHDATVRWAAAESAVKAIETCSILAAPPTETLAVCREAAEVCTELPGRDASEAWFDKYLGTNFQATLRYVVTRDPTLALQVRPIAKTALSALFERPDAGPLPADLAGLRDSLRKLAE